jgi:glucuronate isomerase
MNYDISKIALDLLQIHNSKKATVFFEFSGHVEKIEVRIFIPAWKPDAEADIKVEAYLDNPQSFETFEQEITRFIKLFNLLTQN